MYQNPLIFLKLNISSALLLSILVEVLHFLEYGLNFSLCIWQVKESDILGICLNRFLFSSFFIVLSLK